MSTNLMHRLCLVCGEELEELLSCSHTPAYRCDNCSANGAKVYFLECTFKAVLKEQTFDYDKMYPWRERQDSEKE